MQFSRTSVLVSLQMSFIGYQAQQLVLVLSDLQESFLSPGQSVLLYQRCRLLLACLQYNNQLAEHLRSHLREEFRLVLLNIQDGHGCLKPSWTFGWGVLRPNRSSFPPSRYFVKLSCAEEKLPPHYPISQPTIRLVKQILDLHRWSHTNHHRMLHPEKRIATVCAFTEAVHVSNFTAVNCSK